jgi:hypothetical protein
MHEITVKLDDDIYKLLQEMKNYVKEDEETTKATIFKAGLKTVANELQQQAELKNAKAG